MSERTAFLAAIRAQPDEDTPRLAFADWLDEQGKKPDQYQADFIRTACHFARAEPWSEEWRKLNKRSQGLHRRIPPAWTAHLKGRAIASSFERGFVGHITVFSKRFVAEGGKFFDADPIRSVKFATLRSARGSVSPAVLFACPHLAHVAKLFLDGSELKDKDLALLAASPHAAGVRMLSLAGDNAFTRAALPKLLMAMPRVTELNLTGNTGFKDTHAKPLADSSGLANLTSLDLGGTGLSPVGVAAVVQSKHAANLKKLRLTPQEEYDEEHDVYNGRRSSRAEGRAVAEAIAASLALRSLEDLELSWQQVGNDGLALLAESRGLPALRRLNLENNAITKKGLIGFAKTPLAQQLRFLDLVSNHDMDMNEKQIKDMFPNAHVRVTYDFL